MFLLGQEGLDQGAAPGGGPDLNLPFPLGAVWAGVLADVVQALEYRTRPYEVNRGETDRVSRESVEYLYEAFRRRPARGESWTSAVWHLGTGYFVNAMREVRRRLAAIEVDRMRVKPVGKDTGRLYPRTVEGDPNHNIHRWLESEGAEG